MGRRLWIYWRGDSTEYVNMGYEFDLAIARAHRRSDPGMAGVDAGR
jgi:hypothetical protein